MPEGPEVKLSADLIRPLVVGKQVIKASPALNSRYFKQNPEGYSEFYLALNKEPCIVEKIETRGKFMYWTFSNSFYMFSTFGMTGQWAPKTGNHPCFVFVFKDDSTMVFNDPRHFGTIKFTDDVLQVRDKLNSFGWDPLTIPAHQNLRWIAHQLSKTNKPIAEVLMNQGIFSGVGNYIRAEALYLSKLSPWRTANKLSQDEIVELCQNIEKVMQDSYQHQGATIQTYKTAYGEEGRYSSLFKVYGQAKDPLGHKIIKEQTPDKRTIHWCPDIQK